MGIFSIKKWANGGSPFDPKLTYQLIYVSVTIATTTLRFLPSTFPSVVWLFMLGRMFL